mmetsp:Transcript_693/g.1952  ORF Transcript_693/g.1952 Transcript_693/m.1952 type:complete len:230 (-) Transcript_693:6-695(-)
MLCTQHRSVACKEIFLLMRMIPTIQSTPTRKPDKISRGQLIAEKMPLLLSHILSKTYNRSEPLFLIHFRRDESSPQCKKSEKLPPPPVLLVAALLQRMPWAINNLYHLRFSSLTRHTAVMAIVSAPPRLNLPITHRLQSIGPQNLRCPCRLWRPKRNPGDVPLVVTATTSYSQILRRPMERVSILYRLKVTARLIVTTSQSPVELSREVACERGQQLRSIMILRMGVLT